MRKLFYIPIVHTPEDLGSHLEEVKRQYITRHGPVKWRDHLEAVSKFWGELSEALLNLPVDYTNMRLYQDSLPVCEGELEIVKELANHGNKNHQLLRELLRKGATVMGTEDPKLLVEEREQLAKKSTISVYDDLMMRRDKYIARRIASTLKDGEIGILLMGAFHKVLNELSKDIQVYGSLEVLKGEKLI